jgi:hypothetical protein
MRWIRFNAGSNKSSGDRSTRRLNMANVGTTPRDQEERRLRGGTITERARDQEERRLRPDLTIITPAERARDAETARLAAGVGR